MATLGESLPQNVIDYLTGLKSQLPVTSSAADPIAAKEAAQAAVDAASTPAPVTGSPAADSAATFEDAGMIPGKSAADSSAAFDAAYPQGAPGVAADRQLVALGERGLTTTGNAATPAAADGTVIAMGQGTGDQLPAVIGERGLTTTGGAAADAAGAATGDLLTDAGGMMLKGLGRAALPLTVAQAALSGPESATASPMDGPVPGQPGKVFRGQDIISDPNDLGPINAATQAAIAKNKEQPDTDSDNDADTARGPQAAVPAVAADTPVAAAAATTSKLDPVVEQYLKDKQDLADAQNKAGQNRMFAGLARASAQAAHGLSTAQTPMDDSAFKTLDENANQPVTDLQAKQAYALKGLQDMQTKIQTQAAVSGADPNSAESKQIRALYAPLFVKAGLDPTVLDSLGASDIKAYAQQPLEAIDKMKSQETQKAIQLELTRSRVQQAQENRQTQAYNATVQQLETGRGQPVVQQAERDIYAAQKANTLIAQAPGGDPNKLSDAQVHMLYADIGKIAAGGQPQQSELNFITPSALVGKLSKVYSNFVNSPTPAYAGAFIQQAKQYADGLTKDAQNVITDRYNRVIGAKSSQFSGDQNAMLKTQYVDRFKQAADQGLKTPKVPNDSEAVTWAKANPTDPRAAKILQLNSGQ